MAIRPSTTAFDLDRIQDLFHRALSVAPEHRGRFLADACGGDTPLVREVATLLDHDANTSHLDRPRSADALRAISQPDDDTGARIGPWRLVEVIGRGGMGTVYRADRADSAYRGSVAVKIVNRGRDSAAMLARFVQERQILAELRHPAIVQLLDGGTTDDGRPYLAMELVDGLPIDDFCRRNDLDVPARLRLFLEVCDAVSHAHRALLVHRDLKPSNILVTPSGRPKLLDFGTAILLDRGHAPDSGTDTNTATAPPRFLTPGYASPEQIEGGHITTAADVFGLGVVLFELLAGNHPFRRVGRETRDALSATCDDTAPRLSLVASSSGMRRQLSGDLDAIVDRALARHPENRYPGADALGDDIRRHLDNRPVAARCATLSYRTGRWLRRHRAIAGAGLLISVLVIGWAATLWTAREQASLEAARSRRVMDLLGELFRVETTPSTVTPMDDAILSNAIVLARTTLEDDPVVRAELLCRIGEIFLNLTRLDEAETVLTEAVNTSAGESDTRVRARTLTALATLHHMRSNYAGAERLLDEALTIFAHDPGLDPGVHAWAVGARAAGNRWRGNLEEASAGYRRAAAISRNVEDSTATASFLGRAAHIRHLLGDDVGAMTDIDEALIMAGETSRAESQLTAALLETRGITAASLGRLDEADDDLARAETVRRTRDGRTDPSLGSVVHTRGWLAIQRGRWRAATTLLDETLELYAGLGADSVYAARASMWRAEIDLRQGDLESAEHRTRHALDTIHARLGSNAPDAADALSLLADIAAERGEATLAADLAETSIAILQQQPTVDGDRVAAATCHHVDHLVVGGRITLQAAREIAFGDPQSRQEVATDDSFRDAPRLLARAKIELMDGHPDHAEMWARHCLAVLAPLTAPTRADVVTAELILAEALLAQGRHADAASVADSILVTTAVEIGPSGSWRVYARQLVDMALTAGDHHDAAARSAPDPESS
jgi:serine/threonine-protein kinase